MIAEHVQSSGCYTFGKNQTTVAASLACVNQKALFAQTKVFMYICGKFHGFYIPTALCWSTSERRQAERLSFTGDEHEYIELHEKSVAYGVSGCGFPSNAGRYSSTRVTLLRAESSPTGCADEVGKSAGGCRSV